MERSQPPAGATTPSVARLHIRPERGPVRLPYVFLLALLTVGAGWVLYRLVLVGGLEEARRGLRAVVALGGAGLVFVVCAGATAIAAISAGRWLTWRGRRLEAIEDAKAVASEEGRALLTEAAVRHAWPRRGNWRGLRHACRVEGTPIPTAIVLGPEDSFNGLTEQAPFNDGAEPTPLSWWGGGRAMWASVRRPRTIALAMAAALVWLFVIPLMLSRALEWDTTRVVVATVFLGVLGLLVLARTAPRLERAVAGGRVVAAPGVVRSTRFGASTTWSVENTTLVVRRAPLERAHVLADLVRDDGETLHLRFGGPRDESLRTLWRMWTHPAPIDPDTLPDEEEAP